MLNAMNFRHACKIFDETKKISEQDKHLILEFGRLSPSSFGLEPWHFLIIEDANLREQLKPACWDQVQITSSSFIVIYLTHLPYLFKTDTAFMKQRSARKNLSEEYLQTYLKKVQSYLVEQNTFDWAKRQGYIALANMMTGAASLGIDSCPLEGFSKEDVKEVLGNRIDWNKFEVNVIAAFGYRKNEPPKKLREPLSNIATFI